MYPTCWSLLVLVVSAVFCQEPQPELHDDRLTLTLFAENPSIVTPIGMAIDASDQVFVIESHTHHPPEDYDGPSHDRVKVFVDHNNDGHADSVRVFADGLHQAMNLAFSPKGELFAVCARSVVRLPDADNDGRCDQVQTVVELETSERYAHNSLLGITFDRTGWMYIARGNTGSKYYRFRSAGSPRQNNCVQGYGDGGSVIRCRADGSDLQEFATGFWNPFDLGFDRNGHLLLVDNDPDARGPNRLVHVVMRGNYGYKSLFGGGGNHPFQGWDGTLPGTLPFIAGTGEAPSGLIDCQRTAFPVNFADSVLATIWNENSIESYELQKAGESLSLRNKSVLLQGSKTFRPVALDCDTRGNLFITDWVLVNYPNHGRGRIWRIAAKPDVGSLLQPASYFAPYREPRKQDQAFVEQASFLEKVNSSDPFAFHRAVIALSKAEHHTIRRSMLKHPSADVRLAALLALRHANEVSEEAIRTALLDSNESLKIAALMWIGEGQLDSLRSLLPSALSSEVTVSVFDAYLAANEMLDPQFIREYESRAKEKSNQLLGKLAPKILLDVLRDSRYSPQVRGLALSRLPAQKSRELSEELITYLQNHDDAFSMAIVQTAFDKPVDSVLRRTLFSVAIDSKNSTDLRCEAILALSHQPEYRIEQIQSLMTDSNEDVAIEAKRALARPLTIDRSIPKRSKDEWVMIGKKGGKASRGRRVFFSKKAQCSRCHAIEGRGSAIGPSLAHVGQSKSRLQILEAILSPSTSFAPQFQAWIVTTADGQAFRGLQLDHKAGGAIEMILDDGSKRRFESRDIESYHASPSSLMPEGLEQVFHPDEFRDLIAFLVSQR